VRAYKFLRAGGAGRFSGYAWPLPAAGGPGPWVDAQASVCATGIHGCAPADLPYWLDAELWELELAGPVERGEKKLVAARGRLLRRVEAWDDAAMRAFAQACRARVEERTADDPGLAELLDDTSWTVPSTSSFVAARVAELDAGADAYAAEREWQARWLADRLGLEQR
jgi:hypothetical protein